MYRLHPYVHPLRTEVSKMSLHLTFTDVVITVRLIVMKLQCPLESKATVEQH